MNHQPTLPKVALALVFCIFPWSFLHAQGPLSPPGTPAPTMKTLQQVEPRTAISSLPFAITQPGSYYLTGNVSGSGGITITASGVTLDLMGFELVGGSGSGILVTGTRTNLVIRNGVVRNWSGLGVAASSASNSVFRDLLISDNNDTGLSAGTHSLVSDCLVRNNIFGIIVAAASKVRGCTVSGSLGDGIQTGAGCTVSGSTAVDNNGNGILAGNDSRISDCIARGNIAGDGIQAGSGCTVRDCTATLNSASGINVGTAGTVSDCTANNNTSAGIQISSRCLVVRNHSHANVVAGINVSGHENRVEENHVNYTTPAVPYISTGVNLFIRNASTGSGSWTVSAWFGTLQSTETQMNTEKNPHGNFQYKAPP
jgi:parallel beta-helix repeat protein